MNFDTVRPFWTPVVCNLLHQQLPQAVLFFWGHAVVAAKNVCGSWQKDFLRLPVFVFIMPDFLSFFNARLQLFYLTLQQGISP